MFSDKDPTSRMVACPKCGLYQRITFPYSSVGIEQRCIGCGEFALFEMPTALTPIVEDIKRRFR